MALTATKLRDIPFGNIKKQTFDLTFGSSDTSGTVKTGLSKIDIALYISTVDDAFDIYPDFSDAGTTASPGDVFINNVANSATGRLTVEGV
jgi:hypothetical protein